MGEQRNKPIFDPPPNIHRQPESPTALAPRVWRKGVILVGVIDMWFLGKWRHSKTPFKNHRFWFIFHLTVAFFVAVTHVAWARIPWETFDSKINHRFATDPRWKCRRHLRYVQLVHLSPEVLCVIWHDWSRFPSLVQKSVPSAVNH